MEHLNKSDEMCTGSLLPDIRKSDLFADEESQRFEVQTETGEICTAELLLVVELEGKEYAVYTLPCDDEERCDILASYVVKDAEGYDNLRDIDDPRDKLRIREYILDTVNSLL